MRKPSYARGKAIKQQNLIGPGSGKNPGNTQADEVDPVVGYEPVAVSRAHEPRTHEPGAAAKNARAIGFVGWSGAILGSGRVSFFVVAVLYPLPDIAVHVVKAEGVGLELADRCGLLPVPLAPASIAVRHDLTIELDVVTPGIARMR